MSLVQGFCTKKVVVYRLSGERMKQKLLLQIDCGWVQVIYLKALPKTMTWS